MFPIFPVDSRKAESLEQLGAKRKFWYRDRDHQLLFKAEERDTGDDWAEKVACELCELLGLPHVHYDLAKDIHRQCPGVVCQNCAPPPTELRLGNELLLTHDPSYPVDDARKYKVSAHTVGAVAKVLKTMRAPSASWCKRMPKGVDSALGVFVGYVMLDAWIANQDRHHQNWGALWIDGTLYLAPTFDHAASMARNVTDDERRERLTTRDCNRQIGEFVRKAKSAFYTDATQTKPLKTIEAWAAFEEWDHAAGIVWREALAGIGREAVSQVLAKVPSQRMTDVCREFTLQLLLENQKRLLA